MQLKFTTRQREAAHQGEMAFTLAEVMVALMIFGMVTSGLILGYVQVNRMAEWSSMSLAAQSCASQGLEVAKSGQWDYMRWPNTNYGPGTTDELGFPPAVGQTNFSTINTMDVPSTGSPIYITNFVTICNVYPGGTPPVRQIRSDCVWTFPLTGQLYTNTMISLRAPDQ
jgi:type II secretory pathway pseudopilin PulG